MSDRTIIDGCALATMDATGTEYESGHIVIEGNRIAAIGSGAAPAEDGATVIEGAGLLATPGLVNSHHHLYQWLTRGLAQEATLFEWLTELYPRWALIDDEMQDAAARAGLAALLLSGCTTSMDHHYVFPRGAGRSPRDRDRRGGRARDQIPPDARLDGSRSLRRRTTSRLGDRDAG